jgi:hypothetical protein
MPDEFPIIILFTILPTRCQIEHNENEDFQNDYQNLVLRTIIIFLNLALPCILKVA